MIMKQFLRKTMKNVAAYVELFLSAVLVFVIVVLIIKLIGQCFLDIWHDKIKLEYYMEYIMSLAIGVEFVKMLCTHKPGTIIEVLLNKSSCLKKPVFMRVSAISISLLITN